MNPKINSYSLEDLAKHHEQTQSVVHRYVTESDVLDDRKAFVKKEFQLLKEIERLEIELKKRDEQNAALTAQNAFLIGVLESIGQSHLEDGEAEAAESVLCHTRVTKVECLHQVRADAGRDGYKACLQNIGYFEPEWQDDANAYHASILAGKE